MMILNGQGVKWVITIPLGRRLGAGELVILLSIPKF
jgi:hypothetical protein